ncbi:hypothetical protein CCP3SC1AL1_680007 [Gammaproteobacteria bacterium]
MNKLNKWNKINNNYLCKKMNYNKNLNKFVILNNINTHIKNQMENL